MESIKNVLKTKTGKAAAVFLALILLLLGLLTRSGITNKNMTLRLQEQEKALAEQTAQLEEQKAVNEAQGAELTTQLSANEAKESD